MKDKILIVSVHPDDETLGAGGTLLRHKKNEDELYWLIVTKISEEAGFSKSRVHTREEEIKKIKEAFGFIKVFRMEYPTMSLTDTDILSMIPKISDIFLQIKPNTIYLINRSDAHSDHRIAFEAVLSCTKSFRYPFVKKVLMYECISETEFAPALPERVFIPNYFVDISDFLEEKIAIMNIFESEVGAHPFPRSLNNIKALAHFRGAMAGVQYAEAFQLLKFIDKDAI